MEGRHDQTKGIDEMKVIEGLKEERKEGRKEERKDGRKARANKGH